MERGFALVSVGSIPTSMTKPIDRALLITSSTALCVIRREGGVILAITLVFDCRFLIFNLESELLYYVSRF